MTKGTKLGIKRKKEPKMHTLTLTVQTMEVDDRNWMAFTKIGGQVIRGSFSATEIGAIQALFRDMTPGVGANPTPDITTMALAMLFGKARMHADDLPELPEASVDGD